MPSEDILSAGIAAAKSGALDKAASLLAQAVKANPASVEGWYWLGRSLFAPDRREYCFRRVLALDPSHSGARQELGLAVPGPQPPSPSNLQSEVPGSLKESSPSRPLKQPYSRPVDSTHEKKSESSSSKVNEPSPQARLAAKPRPQRKKGNKTLVFLTWSLVGLILCCLVVVAYTYSGQLLPLVFPTTPTNRPLSTMTAAPTATQTSATQTLTPLPPTPLPSPKPTVSYTAVFENVDCPFEKPAAADVRCGYAIIPEDRSGDPGRTIRLLVAIYHSDHPDPAQNPLIFLQGGPGAEAVQLSADAYDILVAPFINTRDFIVFDQRGTGLSQPALECEELTKVYLQDIHGLIPASTRKLVYSNAFFSCNGVMRVQGVALDSYTTVASAADVRDILSLLGYQKADFYAASYGTRLAQVMMRDYPELVNSVILDSVVPVETNLFSEFQAGIESALDSLFAACAATSECNEAYPQLKNVFWELVNQLDEKPVTVTTSFPQTGTITETLNGSTFMNVILSSIKQSSLIATAPQTIYRFKNGDYSALIDTQSSLPYVFEGISPGLYISMMCHEHILATTLDELQTASQAGDAIREYAWLPFYGDADEVFKTCKTWGAHGPWQKEDDPVTSDIPTLLITGRFDPTTPPLYAEQLAAHLGRSYYLEFPNQGHTPTVADTSGCAVEIAKSFLAQPSEQPDRSCLDEVKPLEFTTPYTGSPAYPLATVREAGISVKVPRGWVRLGNGIYLRNNSQLDIAQVGIVQAPIKPTQVQEYFTSIAMGYLGLDTAPVEAGRRQENGMDWILYSSTSDGRPVDIGVAGYRNRSLVLSLIANSDEHVALYTTVFLPMLTSAQP